MKTPFFTGFPDWKGFLVFKKAFFNFLNVKNSFVKGLIQRFFRKKLKKNLKRSIDVRT